MTEDTLAAFYVTFVSVLALVCMMADTHDTLQESDLSFGSAGKCASENQNGGDGVIKIN